MTRIVIAAAALLLPLGSAHADQGDAGFCGRMAAQLGMNPAKPVNGKAVYEARALKGLGAALFGGTTAVSMMLKPPASGDIGDPERFATACGAVAKGVRCEVSGPATFEMAVGDKVANTDVATGEAALVSMANNRVRCEAR